MGVGKKSGRTTSLGRKTMVFIAWIVVMCLVALGVLYIASRVGEFDSISAMLDFIASELGA